MVETVFGSPPCRLANDIAGGTSGDAKADDLGPERFCRRHLQRRRRAVRDGRVKHQGKIGQPNDPPAVDVIRQSTNDWGGGAGAVRSRRRLAVRLVSKMQSYSRKIWPFK